MGNRVKGPHEDLTYRIIGAAMAVHRKLGPGYRERFYQRALEDELKREGLSFEPEKSIPVYDGDRLLGYYIPDFVVEGKVIVEIKAFAALHQKYLGQVITYLNYTRLPVGLLINFGARNLRWRRVLPSPQAAQFHYGFRWMFVPDWLKAQKWEERGEDVVNPCVRVNNPCRAYLVQHGEAQPKSVDPTRPLTAEGRQNAQRVAALAARMGLDVWQIRHSGKTRAEQTAEIFGAVLHPPGGVVAVAGLAPADDAKPVAKALAREERPIMLVGHRPFLAALAGLLVAGDPDRPVVQFRYAAIVCLNREDGRWLVEWILTPEMAGA